ncbi:hypothetical protein FRAHR75_460048 [Frankia sp. Hr75.2]|nr:hypothetical protein FRAHR75_460048 [Frankia sp. Hr75.2]
MLNAAYRSVAGRADRGSGGPNLSTHVSAAMHVLSGAQDRLHLIRLPAHAPALNPVEMVGSADPRTRRDPTSHGL